MYLAIGMSYREFWEGEGWLVKSYREAHRIRTDEINHAAWLNGVYVLKALNAGVPVVLTGVVKERVKLPEFPETPIDFSEKGTADAERKQMELQKARMQMIAEQFNATFRKKHGMDKDKGGETVGERGSP